MAVPVLLDFAQACARCHNSRYRELLFQWQGSLDSRLAASQAIVDQIKPTDPRAAEILTGRINEAKNAGFHNISAAIKILDDINGHRGATTKNGQ